jgi:hypothetical protein
LSVARGHWREKGLVGKRRKEEGGKKIRGWIGNGRPRGKEVRGKSRASVAERRVQPTHILGFVDEPSFELSRRMGNGELGGGVSSHKTVVPVV